MSGKKRRNPDLRNWTKGPDGKFVIWNQPPYRVGNRLRLVLDHEDYDRIPTEVHRRRILEYYALVRREIIEAGRIGRGRLTEK